MIVLICSSALFNTSRHALGICRRVCNTCRYQIRGDALRGQSLETAIENAVAIVAMQHGILRVGIVDENSKEPTFSFVEAIDLQEMVRWKSLPGEDSVYDDALLKSLEGIHDSLWEDLSTRPGWELVVHHSANVRDAETVVLDITFAFHHAYADGVASKLFHRDLLRALNSSSVATAELKERTLRLASPPSLLPGMETLVPFKISWSYMLRIIWNEIVWQNLVPNFFKSQPLVDSIPWTGENISFEPHHVNIRLIEIPQHALAKLLRTGREHQTSLTPVLHALLGVSLAKRLPAGTAPAFSTTTPIDLRRYAKPEYDVRNNVAALVSAHDDVFDSSSLSRLRESISGKGEGTDAWIWQEASWLSTRLRYKVSTLPNDDVVGMLSWVSDWKKYWTDKIGTKRGSSWEISNVGAIKAEESQDEGVDGWTITRSVMTQGALPAGSAFTVSVSGVEGQEVALSLTWQETIVGTEVMDDLASNLKSLVKRFGENGSFGMA